MFLFGYKMIVAMTELPLFILNTGYEELLNDSQRQEEGIINYFERLISFLVTLTFIDKLISKYLY